MPVNVLERSVVAERTTTSDDRAVSFGPFRLLTDQRLLLEGEKPVRLGSRALDILVALVEHPGQVVGKNELIARGWPNTIVEESNLKFQISALRRTLGGGNRYLLNVPGRGYCFIAPVTRTEQPKSVAPQATATEAGHNLPAHLTRLIGRDDTVSRLARQLAAQRLLTIVGPGGIGKTSVALAVAEAVVSRALRCARNARSPRRSRRARRHTAQRGLKLLPSGTRGTARGWTPPRRIRPSWRAAAAIR